ncbi:MAG: hypothetical protein KGR26_13900, partial [Cyanobacteria bacterium REEB65]|nr:hypothetical protein [Cyanobacteria bacterium REEB65]
CINRVGAAEAVDSGVLPGSSAGSCAQAGKARPTLHPTASKKGKRRSNRTGIRLPIATTGPSH